MWASGCTTLLTRPRVPRRCSDACNVAGALGFGDCIERGPGRQGPGHAQYLSVRDPDGHRAELFTTHYQLIDVEHGPVGWIRRQG
jgi:catechol 2,3-dioxygenase